MAKISPCSAFHYYYDGPNPSLDTSSFTIHCTLEKGAEAYYSGIRIVVIAKKEGYDESFAKAEIQPRYPTGVNMLTIEQQPEDKDFGEVINTDTSSEDGLPTYSLILELVDSSNAIWSGTNIVYQSAAETSKTAPIPETHRILYQYEKRTTVHSPSCVLLLATRHVGLRSRRRLKQNYYTGFKFVSPPPVQMGPPTHGFRILPPSENRPLFTQPPPEIMCNIFSILARDSRHFENWRRGLVSVSLVCRAWWRSALCIVYEDFDSDSRKQPDIRRLATVLRANPTWGRYIKRFSTYCFATKGVIGVQLDNSALTILKTALNMRMLSVGNVSPVLAEEFVEAFCNMTELRKYTQLSASISVVNPGSEEESYLNEAQLAECFAHWPRLRCAAIDKTGERASAADQHDEFPPAQCTLDEIRLECRHVSLTLLRAITASSRATLHTVVLRFIRGSNEELKTWLFDFGPNLTSLTLQFNDFTRREEDELALDETIHQMCNLSHLVIEGAVASVLTLLLFDPNTMAHVSNNDYKQRSIHITNPKLIDPHAFVVALRTTKWENISVVRFRMLENLELADKAEKVASERGIFLFIN